jgi:cbb3-type cytochrome oxidase maturation protein
MPVLILISGAALLFGVTALGVLFWTIKSGQYDDPQGDAERILIDDPEDRVG